jgi:FkbM family methyltransferase
LGIRKPGGALIRLARTIYTEPLTPRQLLLKKWFSQKGDKTLRLDYPLTNSSIVFDLGGYEGQWTSEIYARYRCKIFVFEAFKEYADVLREQFSNNPDIAVFPFGLGAKNESQTLFVSDDGTSTSFKSAQVSEAEFKELGQFLKQHHIRSVDLIKLNIEGGEFDFLEHVIEKQLTHLFRHIQVQFHSHVANAEARMTLIQQELKKTHQLTYQFPFLWENWTLKN